MHAKASESGHLKRSFSSPPVARATKKGHCAIGCAVAPWGKRSWLTVWGECLEQCEEYRYLSTVVEMVAREVGKKREVFTLHTSRVACINHACSTANPTCGNVKTCIENCFVAALRARESESVATSFAAKQSPERSGLARVHDGMTRPHPRITRTNFPRTNFPRTNFPRTNHSQRDHARRTARADHAAPRCGSGRAAVTLRGSLTSECSRSMGQELAPEASDSARRQRPTRCHLRCAVGRVVP